MNKKYIIRKNEEIQKIIKKSKKIINKYFIIYYSPNSYNYNRYCISVSKKIGKAHVRNLYKRRIKDIDGNIERLIKLNEEFEDNAKKNHSLENSKNKKLSSNLRMLYIKKYKKINIKEL